MLTNSDIAAVIAAIDAAIVKCDALESGGLSAMQTLSRCRKLVMGLVAFDPPEVDVTPPTPIEGGEDAGA